MRKLLTTTAVAMLVAGPMLAQTTPAQTDPAMNAPSGAASEGFIQSNETNDIFGSDLIGMSVYSSEEDYSDQPYNEEARADWDDIGDVNDVLLGSDGQVKAVLVDVGGFLGMGEHTVALDMSQIHMLRDEGGDRFVAVNFTEDQLKNAPVFERTGSTMDGSAGTGDNMAQDTDADAGADTGTMMPADARPAIEREGYADVDYSTLTAEDLTGATVYDVNDEAIGDISELVIDPSGKIDQAVLDVGGFLGMGAHTVALPFDEMQIMREGDGGEIRVYVDESKDSLKQRPQHGG
jgi:hypothetical protein